MGNDALKNTQRLQAHLVKAHKCRDGSAALARPGQSHRELHERPGQDCDRDHPYKSFSPSA